jgi:hypothetical protein
MQADQAAGKLPPEGTPAYCDGVAAHRAGSEMDTNPHTSQRGFNDDRFRWFVGWLDAQHGFAETGDQ